MLRKFLMLCPALAFALPFVAANPTMARPLTAPTQPSEWCWGDQDCGDDQDLLLAVCVQTSIFVQTGQDDRSFDCNTLTGPSCLASCAGATSEDGDTCRSQCDGEGALFCSPAGKSRWGDDWFDQIGDDDRDDDDDHNFDDDEAIFINTETCLQLDLNSDL